MKLLLTASGITTPELQQAFSELTGGRTDLTVALILTAGDPIEWVPDPLNNKRSVAKQFKQNNWTASRTYLTYKERGFNVVNGDLKQDPDLLRKKLENVDIIDVGGGDVNWLLDWAKKAKLDTYLKDILARDVLYIGGSAGSMLPQPDIGLTWWDPVKWEGEDHAGLGVVNFLTTGGHGKPADEPTVDEIVKNTTERRGYLKTKISYPWKIYIVMDGQAIKVDGDRIEHIGPGVKKSI